MFLISRPQDNLTIFDYNRLGRTFNVSIMQNQEIYLSIVIITFNEGISILEETIDAVYSHLKQKGYKFEVIISDESDRRFKEQLRKYVEEKKSEFDIRLFNVSDGVGKGNSVKQGMLEGKGKYKMFMDADNAAPFPQIDKLISQMSDNDIAIGSRYVKDSRIIPKRALSRTIISRGGNAIIRSALRIPFKDTRCGFKLFKREASDAIFSLVCLKGFGFEDESLMIAQKHGFRVAEVPVDWYDMEVLKGTTSSVKLNHIFYSFVEMALIKWNLLKGKYERN